MSKTTTTAPTMSGTGDPCGERSTEAGTASTTFGLDRLAWAEDFPALANAMVVVVVHGRMVVVVVLVVVVVVEVGGKAAPGRDGEVDGSAGGTTVVLPAGADGDFGAVVGAVLVARAGAAVVAVVGLGPAPTTEALVARTALGGNDGSPLVPPEAVDPNVHASTLPGRGW